MDPARTPREASASGVHLAHPPEGVGPEGPRGGPGPAGYEEPAFEDRRAGLLLGLLLALGALATGALWWGLAEGSARYWHPGILGVIVTPLALLAALVYGVRLLRHRA